MIPALMAATALFAQNNCTKDHPIYKTDNTSSPKAVYRLGSNPEFPFLQNLSTRQQVLAAMQSKENAKKYPRQMKELNKMLKEIGFSNGVQDVTLSAVSSYNVSPGTTGNMGDGHLNYSYSRLEGTKPHKAWKITSGEDCNVSFLAACGNAFYPFGTESANAYSGYKPKCTDIPVSVSADAKKITVDATKLVTKKTYVYYKRGCECENCKPGWSEAGYKDGLLSRPLLVKKEEVNVPQTYKVTTGNTGTATICPGKPMEVNADIEVESENEYAGFKPAIKKEYVEVSRREYRIALRDREMMEKLKQRANKE